MVEAWSTTDRQDPATVIDCRVTQVSRNSMFLPETGSQLADVAAKTELQALADSGVLEKLTDPKTLANLGQLLDRLEVAAFSLESLVVSCDADWN